MKLKEMKRPAETPPGAPIYGRTGAYVVCFLGENMETIEETTMQKHIPKVEILRLKTYLAMIEDSVGSKMFRHLYGLVDGEEQDLTDNGLISCAYYVSSVLGMPNFALVKQSRATVRGLTEQLERDSWVKINQPDIPGQVLIWEEMKQADGAVHPHSGFFIGSDQAISHIDKDQTPGQHHMTFGVNDDGTPKRKIIAVYTHPFLSP